MIAPLLCAGCERYESPSKQWRALWLDGGRNLILSRAWSDEFAEMKQVHFVCGDAAAHKLISRFLASGSLAKPVAAAPAPSNDKEQGAVTA